MSFVEYLHRAADLAGFRKSYRGHYCFELSHQRFYMHTIQYSPDIVLRNSAEGLLLMNKTGGAIDAALMK
jgi:hypothetical protein